MLREEGQPGHEDEDKLGHIYICQRVSDYYLSEIIALGSQRQDGMLPKIGRQNERASADSGGSANIGPKLTALRGGPEDDMRLKIQGTTLWIPKRS